MHGTALPRLARALLRSMLHGAERDEVLGDMAEEYAERRGRRGALRARLWLWHQVLGSVPGVIGRSWFGGRTGFESEANSMKRGGLGLESWIMDARFALRGLRSRPQYVLLSVLTLALGIGGTTAVFAIARAVLLEPLPYRDSGELVHFWNAFDWSEAELAYLGDDWGGFDRVAAYTSEGVFMRPEGSAAQLIPGLRSTAALFEVLGARPALGRGFQAGDDAVGAEPTAVLSHGLWQELGGRRDIIGHTIQLDGTPRRVIGVMPAGFWFPDPSVRVWLSTPVRPDNGAGNYALVGRLQPGRAAGGMAEPLRRITSRLAEQFTYTPQFDKTKHAQLTPLGDYLLGPVRPALLATLAGMGVILLMACANVATLMLAQLRGRESELAVRVALGAGRRRLTQQLLVESALLGLLAGVIGAGAAAAGFTVLLAALPLGEMAVAAHADWTLFLTALVLAFAAALLIALAPVFSLWRGDLREALSRARSGGIGARGGRLEDLLVVGEVALAVLLAAGAAVLIRSVENLRAIDPGVRTRGVGVLDIAFSGDVPQEVRQQQMLEMIASLRSVPGVAAASAVQRLPLATRGDNWGIQIMEQPDLEPTTTALRVVGRDYFDVMGIRVLRGRGFEATDQAGSELVIVIDEELATKYFPGDDPVGQHIASGTGLGWMRIVGVVRGVRHSALAEPGGPGRYVLYDQYNYTPESAALVLRVQPDMSVPAVLHAAAASIQRSMAAVAVQDATTMDQVLALAMGPTRRIMQLMTILGALALTLGAVGVYGVVSHFVSRRRRDWVIRMALGMRPGSVIGQVVGRGALLVGAGCALGLAAAAAATRVLASLLFEVSAADPVALLGAAGALIATGCLAALLPAYRASRANAAAVLRDV